MSESTKNVIEFKDGKDWVLNGKDVKVHKIETVTYTWSLDIPAHEKLETVEPYKSLHNIIKNTALLPNGAFIEVDAERILARISDLVYDAKTKTNTLIKTQWYIPKTNFNEMVYNISFFEEISEDKFHVISKIS